MIDITRLTIKAGDTVQCKLLRLEDTHSPGWEEGRIFTVDHFVLNGKNQLLYDSNGQYVYSTEIVIYKKEDELTIPEKNKQSLERILEVVFPDEWYLNSDYELVIHFKEIDIKNSRDEHHLIRDLYVLVYLTSNYTIRSQNIYGMRTTLTESELSCGYRHSHLESNRDFTGYSNFCTGGDMIAELGILLTNKNVFENEDMYENYFETLKTYVAWESVEGGPYVNISSVKSSVGSDFSLTPLSTNFSSNTVIKNLITKYGIEIPIILNLEKSNKLEVLFNTVQIDKDKLKKELLEVALIDLTPELQQILVLKVSCLEYTSRNGITPFETILKTSATISENKIIEISSRNSGYYFKEEQVKNKTLRELNKISYTKNNIDIASNVLDYFIKQSLIKFYGKFFESGIETTSDSNNTEHKSSFESVETI